MNNIRTIEILLLDDLFEMGGGYPLARATRKGCNEPGIAGGTRTKGGFSCLVAGPNGGVGISTSTRQTQC